METKFAVFKGKGIRKVIHNNEWCFSVFDVVAVLTESKDTASYIKKMRKRDDELSKGWGQIVTPLWLDTEGGRIAGEAREKLEKETKRIVVSKGNYLTQSELKKRLEKK